MASDGANRRGLLTAGGILSIVAGVFLISSGVLVAVILLGYTWRGGYYTGNIAEDMLLWFLPFLGYLPPDFGGIGLFTLLEFKIIAVCAGVVGIIALAGGISSIRRKSFGLSLAGAICAIPSVPSGILAVIFVALGKREFRAKGKGNGI